MWWILTVLAGEPVDQEPMPTLVRVDDPGWPGALTRSAMGSVLLEPPPAGVPWRYEPDVRTDGWPSKVGLDALNADAWHERGWRGQGVKVAVFDLAWFAAEVERDTLGPIETVDCFKHASCEVPIDTFTARFPSEEGQHGFACAEIVHEIAPEAELHLVRVNGYTTFENAAAWAIRNDVDVLSMSLSFFNNSFYDGTSPFAPIIQQLLAHDVQLVTSAGNSARQHWMGAWLDADHDGRLDFDGDNRLSLDLGGNGRRTVYINWDEHQSCGDSDLDVIAYDRDGFIVGKALATQDRDADQCDPVERLGIQTSVDGIYEIEIVARRVAEAGLRVDVMTQSGAIVGSNPASTIVDPGVIPGAFAVGAVRADGYLDNPIEGFSSQGPVRSGALKPDIAGPDGLDADAFGAEGFFGTSAATPAVAGALALVLSRYPGLTAPEAAERLQTWAWEPDPTTGWDSRWGAGKARLPVPSSGPIGCERGHDGLFGVILLPAIVWGRRRRVAGM